MESSTGSNSLGGGNVGHRRLDSQQNYVIPGLVCLMVAIALERIAFYMVTNIMTNFFVNVVVLNESSVTVNNYFLLFTGTSNFFPLVGGMLGDSVISRYVCTLIGFLIEAIGSIFLLVLLVIIDKVPKAISRELVHGMAIPGLILMAIGQGFHRANILTLGCEQVGQQAGQTKNVKAVEKFFRGYYWVTNVGALIAHIILAVTESNHVGSEQGAGYYLLGIVQTVALFLGAFFIIVGKRWYIRTVPDGENLRKFSQSFFRKITFIYRCFRRRRDNITLTSRLSEQTDEDKLSTHIFQIILVTSSLIMFGIIYFLETGNIFFTQGKKMNHTVGNNKIPPEVVLGFDSLTIIVVLPIIHFLITPFLTIPLLRKIGIGLLLGCASALTCGIVEVIRLQYLPYNISISWQVPQFVFLSFAEIFVIITNFQFNYCESPPNMEGLVVGIVFCLLGLGSFMARFLIWAVHAIRASWYPSDYDEGEIWKFLFFLAGMQLLFLFIFTWYAYRYQYKYLHGETEGDSARSPLLRGPVQSEMCDTYTSIGSLSVNSYDSLASLRSEEH